jgi:hypothetical protein
MGREVGEEGDEVEEVEGLGDGRIEPWERVVPPRRPAARRWRRRLRCRRNLHFRAIFSVASVRRLNRNLFYSPLAQESPCFNDLWAR